MNLLGITVVSVLLVGVWAQISVLLPECDSPEAEEVARVANEHINAQHTNGYKFVINRIEDIKAYNTPMGESTYVLEIDLLETECHVLDPTPLANCTVRPKSLTAVEGDCDVVLKKVGGALAVTAFKCKTEGSTEDLCLGCPTLLSLNHTGAVDFVHASLATVNNNAINVTYVLHEIGRMSTQVVSGGAIFLTEYVIVEANCTDGLCLPLQDAMAAHGICHAKGLTADHTVDCRMFDVQMPSGNNTATADPAVLPQIHGDKISQLGRKFHSLTTFHNPEMNTYLSAESAESAEVVPVAPAHLPDAAAPLPDATLHLPDAAAPLPDAALHLPDAALHLPDAAAPLPDAALHLPDAAAPLPNATGHSPDAAAPLPDAVIHPPDAAAPLDSTSASDSSTSKEVPPIMFKRDVAAVSAAASPTDKIVLMPVCPGRVRFF